MASSSTVTCGSCGAVEAGDARFCGECGAPIHAVAAQPAPVTSAPTEPRTVTSAPAVAPKPASGGRLGRRRLFARIAAALVIAAAAAVAAWLVFGSSGGGESSAAPTTLDSAAFWSRVNRRALAPLAPVDSRAQRDVNALGSTGDTGPVVGDGIAIETASDNALLTLRRLANLAPQDAVARRVLVSYVRATRAYGLALQTFGQTQDFLAVSKSANEAAAATASLPARAAAPPASIFKLLPPASSSSATSPADFVQQIDQLLNESHGTLTRVKQMASDLASGAISGEAAASEASGLVDERRQTLAAVQGLLPPAGFRRVYDLLVRSLQLSIADDQALADWARAKAAGGTGDAAFAHANALGREASAVKQKFLAAYRILAAQTLGGPDGAIPNSF